MGAAFFKILPNFFPMKNANKDNAQVIMPMIPKERRAEEILSAINSTPMLNASIEVARA